MSRVPLIDAANTTADRQALLGQVHAAFGATPAMFRVVANSPAALQSMWGSFGALGSGRLSPLLGEQIAVAIANRNACEYCLAAHTALGRKAGASSEQMAAAQIGQSSDPATAAALDFALKVVEQRAQIAQAMCRRCARPALTMSRSWRSSRMWRSTCSPTTSTSRSTCRWTSRRSRCAEVYRAGGAVLPAIFSRRDRRPPAAGQHGYTH